MTVKNQNGRRIMESMVNEIHGNKQYLGDIDGLIGDGDHGMNMNKGFMLYAERLGEEETTFTDGLYEHCCLFSLYVKRDIIHLVLLYNLQLQI